MSKIIARVRLAPGNVGYYDDLSRIYLTISRPEAYVYDYMNTTRLIKSVKSKTILLVSGSLNTETTNTVTQVATLAVEPEVTPVIEKTKVVKEEVVEKPVVTKKSRKKAAVAEPVVVEEPVVETVEEKKEEV